MEDLIIKVGAYGRYQKLMTILIASIVGIVSFTTYSSVFVIAEPKFQCYYKNSSIPKNTTGPNSQTCDILANISKSEELVENSIYMCKFDDTIFGSTLITQLKLVCDKAYLPNLTQTFFMLGCFFVFTIGYYSDKYGRKKVLFILSICTTIVYAFLLLVEAAHLKYAFSMEARYVSYTITQFLLGYLTFGIEVTIYVLLSEITSSSYKTLTSSIFFTCYSVGELWVVLIYYFVRNWHYLYVFGFVYAVLATVAIKFLLTESPRIMAAQKRYTEAAEILNKFAKCNGINLSKNIDEQEISDTIRKVNKKKDQSKDDEGNVFLDQKEQSVKDLDMKKPSAWYFLTHHRHNLLYFVLICYVWFTLAMLFFGISLGITSMSSLLDPYLMFLLCALAEGFGFSLGLLARKYPCNLLLRVILILATCCTFVVACVPIQSSLSFNTILVMSCIFIGKAMGALSFNVLYIYTNQLYPTYVRNTFMSLCACACRIGGILAPQTNLLGKLIWSPLPYWVFAVSTLIACLFLFLIPETKEENGEDI